MSRRQARAEDQDYKRKRAARFLEELRKHACPTPEPNLRNAHIAREWRVTSQSLSGATTLYASGWEARRSWPGYKHMHGIVAEHRKRWPHFRLRIERRWIVRPSVRGLGARGQSFEDIHMAIALKEFIRERAAIYIMGGGDGPSHTAV